MPSSKPLISILVPARDEEMNIAGCIEDISDQNYQNYELLILDDESEDNTALIVKNKFIECNISDKAKLIPGKAIAPDWIGKNWACHQLSLQARGTYLLFLDADVRLKSHVIESCLCLVDKYKIQLISCFSTQIIKSLGEWLVVPLMNFMLLTFLPLTKVYSSTNRSFIAANGQFFLIQRAAYDQIGGHKGVANKVVEDMEIARKLKESGLKLMTFLGGDSITCRMYVGFKEAFNGFTKNFFPGFSTTPLIFSLFLIFLFAAFFLPFIMLFVNSKFVWVVLTILLGRLAVSLSSGQNFLINCFIHPVQMIMMIAVGINSVYRSIKKTLRWKGRYI
jgi:chlorobactene glucosyltransferase